MIKFISIFNVLYIGILTKKTILKILVAVAVVIVGLTYYLVSIRDWQVKAWIDSSWTYRRGVEVANEGESTLTDEDVLIEIDTATLISEGKMQADCDDLRFTDTDTSTEIEYWIEGGCNTSATQVWARIPSLPAEGKTIYFYYGNSEATNTEETWSGNFIMYADDTCPSGWTSAADLNGTFLYGSDTYGVTGGSTTHSHDDATCTSSSISTTDEDGGTSGSLTGTTTSHTHDDLSVSVNETSDILPPYEDMIVCYNNEFLLASGLISLFDTTAPSGWTRFTALDDIFPRANGSFGATGGSSTHTHTATAGNVTSSPTGTESVLAPVVATGGTKYTSGSYTIHNFTSSGNFITNEQINGLEYLVIGGGGGGGRNNSTIGGGGGGAGGYLTGSVDITAGTKTVTVGAGGASHTNGANSVFDIITATGGGGGGYFSDGSTGGSGGGASGNGGGANKAGGIATPAGQGNNGYGTVSVYIGGGGGGAGAAAVNQNGGAGVSSSITGSAVIRAGGGGGGGGSCWNQAGEGAGGAGGGGAGSNYTTGFPGTANTGSGGGGGGYNGVTYAFGGAGGSGLVVVRYLTQATSATLASSTHVHDTNDGNVNSASNIPPYLKMIFAKADSSTISNENYILMTSVLPPLGWDRFTDLDSKFPMGSDTYGDTGGSATHTHEVDITTGTPSDTVDGYGTGTSFADATHTHSCTATSSAVSNIPPYTSVIYSERKSSQGVTVLSEEPYNTVPTTPTVLHTQGEINPSAFSDLTPEFSAIYNDPDIDDTSEYYEIEVNTSSDFTSTVMWDTGKTAMTTTDKGDRSPTFTYAGDSLAEDGITYYWRIKFWDSKDVESPWSSNAQFTIDSTAPMGSIIIAEGDTYKATTSVMLTLSATDATSDVYQMVICNNPTFIGCSWESYSTSKNWTLTTGDGTKTVYVKYIDNATNESITYNDTITIDTTAPTGTISINAGSTYATSTSTTLALSATDTTSGIYQMMVCNNSSFTSCTWETYSTSKNWTLTPGDGSKTVYVKFKDNAGLISTVANDTISLDTTIPTGTVSINVGAASTTTTSVTLTLSATDTTSDVYQMMVCNNSSFTSCTWEAYSTSKNWSLTPGDGSKTVYVKFKDNAGLISTVANDTISFATPVIATTPITIAETPKETNVDEEITEEEITQVKAILLETEDEGNDLNQEEGVSITIGKSQIHTKGKQIIHVYQDSGLDLSIPVNSLTKEDSDIDNVYAVLGDDVVKLTLNSVGDQYVGTLTARNITGEQGIDILTIFKDSTAKKSVLGVYIDPYGYVYSLGKDNNQLRIKNATVTLYQIVEGKRTIYIEPGQDNPQKTDGEGQYSFLVGPGTYVLVVKADGYKDYESEELEIESTIIEKNIEIEKAFDIFDYWVYLLGSFIIIPMSIALIKKKK